MNKIVVLLMGFGLTGFAPLSCSTDKVPVGDFDRKVVYNEQTRKYLVHVPPSYTGEKPIALLFALHFFGGSREAMAEVTHFSATSEEQGFIVVYRQSYVLSWQNSDTGFIHVLADILEEEYLIDPDRIYVTGYSNGAYVAHLLAATSDRIASASMVAGGIMEGSFSGLTPVKPVSTIHFHARNDSVLPYYGDEYHEAVETMVYAWAEINGCDGGSGQFLCSHRCSAPDLDSIRRRLRDSAVDHRGGRSLLALGLYAAQAFGQQPDVGFFSIP